MESERVEYALSELAREIGSWDDDDVDRLGFEREELEALVGCRVRTYAEAGVLTRDRGFVLETADGSEFQITIVRSR